MQQIDDQVARGGHHVGVPTLGVAVDRGGAAAVGQEGPGEPDVLHVLERSLADIGVGLRIAGTVVQHGHAGADQFHVPDLLGEDAGDEAVERLELRLRAEVEALEHIVAQGGHLAVLAAKQFLQGRRSVRIGLFRLGQFRQQLVDAHIHFSPVSVLDRPGERATPTRVCWRVSVNRD